jgi:hypothetical protein
LNSVLVIQTEIKDMIDNVDVESDDDDDDVDDDDVMMTTTMMQAKTALMLSVGDPCCDFPCADRPTNHPAA